MSYSFSDAWSQFSQLASRLDQQTWLVVCAIAIVVGYVCLRGFGSRKSY